ncbi:Uncharacterised protein [Vibrio cholerae]|nr:Uncharacterised protein [Vibrio cholerae]
MVVDDALSASANVPSPQHQDWLARFDFAHSARDENQQLATLGLTEHLRRDELE